MAVHSSFTSRLAGGAFAAGALYLLGSRRRRRKTKTAPIEDRERPPQPRMDLAAKAAPAREIGAVEVADLPSDLSLHEIYQRVSFT